MAPLDQNLPPCSLRLPCERPPRNTPTHPSDLWTVFDEWLGRFGAAGEGTVAKRRFQCSAEAISLHPRSLAPCDDVDFQLPPEQPLPPCRLQDVSSYQAGRGSGSGRNSISLHSPSTFRRLPLKRWYNAGDPEFPAVTCAEPSPVFLVGLTALRRGALETLQWSHSLVPSV